MKKILFSSVIILSFFAAGCSTLRVTPQSQLPSYTKVESKKKGFTIGKGKIISYKDFKNNEIYEEDVDALREEVGEYIVKRPELSEAVKASLDKLEVTLGLTKEQVILLLGEPDKISSLGKNQYSAGELCIYRVTKWRAYTVFIIPVFFVHEGYYLYFKDDILAGIERRDLKQMIKQGSAPGVFEAKGGSKEEKEEENK
ncbi:MAG: hypothetical protein V1650_01525 [Candidatus Omnitrophota bacterium]